MMLSGPHERAQRFWNNDLESLEANYLDGIKVTSLRPLLRDGRIPNQGSVLDRAIDVECVVRKPNWLHLALARMKYTLTGGF